MQSDRQTPHHSRNHRWITVIGGGPAGMMAALTAVRSGAMVTLHEKLPSLGRKLKASGGGRCNLTNTLPQQEFMERFGRAGRHMGPALTAFGAKELRSFLADCGVETHAPDGFHVFPVSHRAEDVLEAMRRELRRHRVLVSTSSRVDRVSHDASGFTVTTSAGSTHADAVILAAGGQGYPALGGGVDGYTIAESLGHTVTARHPAMVHLLTRDVWPGQCRADTIPKARIEVRRGKKRQVYGPGDLIFTQRGLAGPLVLDASRHITPDLQNGSVTAWLRLTPLAQDAWLESLLASLKHNGNTQIGQAIEQCGLPESLACVLCELAGITPERPIAEVSKQIRSRIAELGACLPVEITASAGFEEAMVTRGGVVLREVASETLESRIVRGLYICGELLDLDGPCGGYNLQWAFSSGHLAGASAVTPVG